LRYISKMSASPHLFGYGLYVLLLKRTIHSGMTGVTIGLYLLPSTTKVPREIATTVGIVFIYLEAYPAPIFLNILLCYHKTSILSSIIFFLILHHI